MNNCCQVINCKQLLYCFISVCPLQSEYHSSYKLCATAWYKNPVEKPPTKCRRTNPWGPDMTSRFLDFQVNKFESLRAEMKTRVLERHTAIAHQQVNIYILSHCQLQFNSAEWNYIYPYGDLHVSQTLKKIFRGTYGQPLALITVSRSAKLACRFPFIFKKHRLCTNPGREVEIVSIALVSVTIINGPSFPRLEIVDNDNFNV